MANSDSRKIIEFERTRFERHRLAKARDNQSGSRFILGSYFADIVADPTSEGPRVHWVVQRFGSADVIAWGQESSFETARKAAYQYLHEHRAMDAKQTG